jgi:hypothetical protein
MEAISIERPSFFEGQYLGAEDLTELVRYLRTQDARQILGHHTWGIVYGLELMQSEAPDGTLEVFVQPGVAFDGYGRIIAVLARTPLDTTRFTGAPSGEVRVWIRYDEAPHQGVRRGFEVCTTDDTFSRLAESFALEVGEPTRLADRESGIVVGGQVEADARRARQLDDETAPLVCDGSIPAQSFPEDDAEARWLVPLGIVSWRGGSPGAFQALLDEQVVRSRLQRRHAGAVAESLYAPSGILRLRDRYASCGEVLEGEDPCEKCEPRAADFFVCEGELRARELVWVEGHARFLGDARLFGSRLEFRELEGTDYIPRIVSGVSVPKSTPALLQRKEGNTTGGTDLEILIGKGDEDEETINRIVFGELEVSGADLCEVENVTTARVVIQNDGKMGIGAVDTELESPLTIRGIGEQAELLAFESDASEIVWKMDLGPEKTGLNFVEIDPDASRLYLQAGGNVGLGTTAPERSLVLRKDDGPPQIQFQQGDDTKSWIGHARIDSTDIAIMDAKVGIGTVTPDAALHIRGDDPDIFLDINGSSPNQFTELRMGSNGVIRSNIYWSRITEKTYIQNRNTNALVIDESRVGLGTDSPATTLHVATGTDISIGNPASGFLVIGSTTGENIAIDDNEIRARNNGASSVLHLQYDGGNVRVGAASTTARLNVDGDVRLGDAGELLAPGGIENFRILAGTVGNSGGITRGQGFSVDWDSEGIYTVRFSAAFLGPPTVVATLAVGNGNPDEVVSVQAVSSSAFTLHVWDATESELVNSGFSFIAMGPR